MKNVGIAGRKAMRNCQNIGHSCLKFGQKVLVVAWLLFCYLISYVLWYNFCILLGRIEQIQSVMKTLLRNFLSVLRRFRMAAGLNVVGLSVAFTAFLWSSWSASSLLHRSLTSRPPAGSKISPIVRLSTGGCSPWLSASSSSSPSWPFPSRTDARRMRIRWICYRQLTSATKLTSSAK